MWLLSQKIVLKSKLQGTTGRAVVVSVSIVVSISVVVSVAVVVSISVVVSVSVVVSDSVVVVSVFGRVGLVGRGGRGGRVGTLSLHGIGTKILPTGVEILTFKTSSKVEFSGISIATFKEVFIW